MGGLGPADAAGNYTRPSSDPLTPPALNPEDLLQRSADQRPILVIGRSCPWAHRTWLVHQLRHLHNSLTLVMARADHNAGRWALDPAWEGCKTLLELYQHCGAPPSYRATVPVLVDPKTRSLLGNDSAPLVELLNRWPHQDAVVDLAPAEATDRIQAWQQRLQPAINDGVYRCGFARNQAAYDRAEADLFAALAAVEQSLETNGPWLCGTTLTLADVRLFPTLIRWELVSCAPVRLQSAAALALPTPLGMATTLLRLAGRGGHLRRQRLATRLLRCPVPPQSRRHRSSRS